MSTYGNNISDEELIAAVEQINTAHEEEKNALAAIAAEINAKHRRSQKRTKLIRVDKAEIRKLNKLSKRMSNE